MKYQWCFSDDLYKRHIQYNKYWNEEFQAYFITDTQVKKLIKPFIKSKSENKPINDKLLNEDNKTSHNPNKQATDTKENINKDNKIIDLDFIKNL